MGARKYQIYFECWTCDAILSLRSGSRRNIREPLRRLRHTGRLGITRNKFGISKHPCIFLFIIQTKLKNNETSVTMRFTTSSPIGQTYFLRAFWLACKNDIFTHKNIVFFTCVFKLYIYNSYVYIIIKLLVRLQNVYCSVGKCMKHFSTK
jgi:hypothetical protein